MNRSLISRTLRARLAIWHALLLALTLGALVVLTLAPLRSFLHSRADAGLYDYADKTARSIAAELYEASLNPRAERPRFLNRELQEWGRQIQVVDSNGNVVEKSDGLASHPLYPKLTERVNGLHGKPTFDTRYDLGDQPVRVVSVPVEMGREYPYLVQAAASLEGIEEALQRAAMILAVVTPSVFLISLLGGWMLVSRSLRPVDEITRTALAIEHTNLDRRIEPPGTDDEIARLASAFNEMIARLDQSFRQIQQFSADASHELKTPLTAMRGEAEVALLGERTPEEYRGALRSIVDDVERMSAIVDNLLLLARADADQLALKRERIAVHELALEVFEQMERIARRRNITLDLGEIEEATIEGDRLWIGQIVTNLLNNALKYTPAGGRVALAVRQTPTAQPPTPNPQNPTPNTQNPTPKPEVLITITDTGPGIPPEHLERIFDRFYRVDSGRSRDAGGVGLGLNIARWAAESHGGRIEVESKVGEGSTFTLILPASP